MSEGFVGLACPHCQGRLEISEGERIVRCPFCEQRSLVRGERGVLRYQAPRAVGRKRALNVLFEFMSGLNRAPDLRRTAQLSELFVAYLPFWSVWARVTGWVFGQKRVGSGRNRRYVPREVKVLREMSWNEAACDVGEFGAEVAPLDGQPLRAFVPQALHADGMVFEPVGSPAVPLSKARDYFAAGVRDSARLQRHGWLFVRRLSERIGIVYYPLWVGRYLHRGRAYQVVIDGHRGRVLYGKAPGNRWYRAAALVLGMALGAAILVLGSCLAFGLVARSEDSDSILVLLLPLIGGIGLMAAAYHAFRYGEEIEYRVRPSTLQRKGFEVFQALMDKLAL